MEIKENFFNLDILLQETLEITEFLRGSSEGSDHFLSDKLFPENDDTDYLLDLADSVLSPPIDFSANTESCNHKIVFDSHYPKSSGVIFRIDDSVGTFCVRGFSAEDISFAMSELRDINSPKRPILKILGDEDFVSIHFFETKSFELAESVREHITNRRFPKIEDSVCNISDPGFSWWMDVSLSEGEAKFEIFFKSHAVNRAEKYIQLGPIGDPAIAALRLNQARTLLRSSFPIAEFVATDRSLTVVTSKPDHLSFISFKNIFLLGENHTEEENFPDNSLGRTLYFYFHELAVIRKFWIEVQKHLS